MTAARPANEGKARAAFLDFLRILAAFLVIVNHTNSYVFKALTPADSQWHWSILWYYVSKTAVPLFIMISGACLLGKRDSYAKMGRRILRTLLALVGKLRPVAPGSGLWRAVWQNMAGRDNGRVLVSAALSGPAADAAPLAEDGIGHGKAGL